MRLPRKLPIAWAVCAVACGGSSPMAPDAPPEPARGDLGVVVYYDENGDGIMGPSEVVRLPGVGVRASSQTAVTNDRGRAQLASLTPGAVDLVLDPDTLPPFYVADPMRTVTLPQSGDYAYPVTLPIGTNRPNLYMAFGDSITVGELSSDGRGYVGRLQDMLRAHFGAAEMANEGVTATRSNRGAQRIQESLDRVHPAYTLVFYGVNDYNDFDCRINAPCFTVDSLRFILESAKATDSLPFLATLTPANTGYDFRAPPFRNVWVEGQNAYIRALAAEEGAVLVDLYPAFLALGPPEESGLLADHIHPNDAGYQIVAETFFEAILHGRPGATTSLRRPILGWAGG